MDECRAEVVDRALDECRRSEDRGVDLHAGKSWLHLLDGRFDPGSDVECVGPWQLLDDEHEPLATVDDCVAEQWLVVDEYVGDVAQQDRCAFVVHRDRHLGQFVRAADRQRVLDVQALVGRLDPAARADETTVGEPQQPCVE